MVKSFKFIVKIIVFEGLTGCVREQKRYQNSIQIDTNVVLKSMKIDAETMLEKVLQKTQKTIQHRVQINIKKLYKIDVGKQL